MVGWLLGLSLAAAACAGGVETVRIDQAYISSGNQSNDAVVRVSLIGRELSSIAEKEIYAHIVIVDCSNETIRYPASPRLDGVPLDRFAAIRDLLERRGDNQNYVIDGNVPHAFLQRLSNTCVKLEGGGYLGGTLHSNQLRIERAGTR